MALRDSLRSARDELQTVREQTAVARNAVAKAVALRVAGKELSDRISDVAATGNAPSTDERRGMERGDQARLGTALGVFDLIAKHPFLAIGGAAAIVFWCYEALAYVIGAL